MQTKYRKNEKGVALLFAILLTSALLLVALGIANVSYKELSFSLEARDSGKAFFAADTGIECALYLDKVGVIDGNNIGAYDCGGNTAQVTTPTGGSWFFALDLGDSCAEVDARIANNMMTIVSYGYNTEYRSFFGTGECVKDLSSRTVIRAIRVSYPI